MVKVIEKSEEELRAEGRFSKLLEIAQNNFTPKRVSNLGGMIFIRDEDSSNRNYIAINPDRRIVTVNHREGYGPAHALARVYEEIVDPEREWTLKKDYVEIET